MIQQLAVWVSFTGHNRESSKINQEDGLQEETLALLCPRIALLVWSMNEGIIGFMLLDELPKTVKNGDSACL